MASPEKVRLVTDDYHLNHFGHSETGDIVWITSQLSSESRTTTDFICTFRFDNQGNLRDHRIDKLGFRGEYDEGEARKVFSDHLATAGPLTPANVMLSVFSVSAYGHDFGLVAQHDDETGWSVKFQPGDTMAFFEPWDSGDYDT